MVDVGMLKTVKHLIMGLITGLVSILGSTGLGLGITGRMIMSPTSTYFTTFYLLQLLGLFFLGHSSPLGTVIKAAAGKFPVVPPIEGVAFLTTTRTGTPLLPELLHGRRLTRRSSG